MQVTVAGRIALIACDMLVMVMIWLAVMKMNVVKRPYRWLYPSFWRVLSRDGKLPQIRSECLHNDPLMAIHLSRNDPFPVRNFVIPVKIQKTHHFLKCSPPGQRLTPGFCHVLRMFFVTSTKCEEIMQPLASQIKSIYAESDCYATLVFSQP